MSQLTLRQLACVRYVYAPYNTLRILSADADHIPAHRINVKNRCLPAPLNTHMVVSNAYPLYPYKSTIVIVRPKITVILSQLVSSTVYSVDIDDIFDITLTTGMVFARLSLYSEMFPGYEVTVRWLWKKEAIYTARTLIGMKLETDGKYGENILLPDGATTQPDMV